MSSLFDLEPGVLPAEAERLREEVREFLDAERASGGFTPMSDSWVFGGDPVFSRKLAERGWVGMTVPKQYGGPGRSPLERFVVAEELLAAGAPISAHWGSDRQIAPALITHGTKEQQERFLPAIVRGECLFAIGLSEPDSGSDLASVRTKATRTEGGWLIDGTKIWTSGAHHAHAVLALVRTGPAGDSRHEGLSQMIVELPGDGVEIRPIRSLNGGHHFNELVFTSAFVPDADVLGEIGNGWAQVTGELAWERSGPERMLSNAVLLRLYAARDDADPRAVGRLVARLWSLRQASVAVAVQLTKGRAPEVAAAMVKDLGTRWEREVIEAARATSVEPDLTSDDPFARLLGEAITASPTNTLRGGTNEILRGVIARALGVR
ncbi:acyl-CoA dehydrogenase family protein [Streptomyces abyssomicinicus]|uniref:acyl-CoA dehydrogenase family protein n=1 Tax=Streptomyces abyssomicinicus TaxID=574929 RepID=UPI001250094D|nr:acyl-CoA dehydrogenase family protein [Streptomyces abyssomicinicus]